MHRTVVMFFIMAIGFTTFAETLNLGGRVADQNGMPVANAVVTLLTQHLVDTTDQQGLYSFVNNTAITIPVPASVTQNKISFENGMLSIHLGTASPVEIGLFDLHGRQLDHIVDRNASAGEYRYNLSHPRYGTRMLVVRVSIGDNHTTFRNVPAIGMMQTISSASTASSGNRLAKVNAIIDTIQVMASGYAITRIPVESLIGQKDITIAALQLDPFSFFVTSLKGLQELSGSVNGFGGDLRLGKTGPGAGLLGADSICGCLAEKSMPGSRAKGWRAFLSAKHGVDGNQVNAIDRIGNGPWYDRLGRLVATNKSDLLSERPKSADAAIINDLPNEFGIQNHRPDPNKAVVDNHLTITGSNSKGELYTGTDSIDMFSGGGFGGFGDFGDFGGFGTLAADSDIKSFGGSTSGTGFGGFGGFGDTSGFGGMGGFSTNPGDSINGWTCDDWTSTTSKANPRAGMSWPQSELVKESGGMMGMVGGINHWISGWNMSGCEAGIDLETNTAAGIVGVLTIGNGGGYGGFYCFALNP